MTEILIGDCLVELAKLPAESVHCCVTSPPYWGLRDYGTAKWEGGDSACDHKQGRNGAGRADGIVDERGQRNRDGVGAMGGDCKKCDAVRVDNQIGLEKTPEEYVAKIVSVFREVRRALRSDGTLWLNLGDSYSAKACTDGSDFKDGRSNRGSRHSGGIVAGLKPKDLVGIPWRVAFALQADGWYLRQDIIWHKPNPMPESVTDRCTKAHEYLFLLSRSPRYYYDAEAIREATGNEMSWDEYAAKTGPKTGGWGGEDNGNGQTKHAGSDKHDGGISHPNGRNKRSVWTIATAPYSEAHFATFPPGLIKPCILAGCPVGGTVLDPFGGSGTTGMVATELGRKSILIELNPEYVKLAERRVNVTPGLPLEV